MLGTLGAEVSHALMETLMSHYLCFRQFLDSDTPRYFIFFIIPQPAVQPYSLCPYTVLSSLIFFFPLYHPPLAVILFFLLFHHYIRVRSSLITSFSSLLLPIWSFYPFPWSWEMLLFPYRKICITIVKGLVLMGFQTKGNLY